MGHSFLRIPGIDGNSSDSNHREWLDILGSTNPQPPPSDRQPGDRKRFDTAQVQVFRNVDEKSALLTAAADKATHFDAITIETVDDAGTRRFVLVDVIISSIERSTSTPPTETITFSYLGIRFEDGNTKPAEDETPERGWGRERERGAARITKPASHLRPVIRASAETTTTFSTLVWSLTLRYSLKGQVLSRIAFAQDAADTALIDRNTPAAEERLLPLRKVHVELRQAGQDPDLDPAIAQVVSGADGSFEFLDLLEEGVEYFLTAILQNVDQKLQQERVTVSGIRVDKLPRNGSSSTFVVRHRNHAVGGTYVADETEDIRASLDSPLSGESVVSLKNANAILFNTLMLDVPYINQNRNPDGSAKSVNIDGIGAVSGGILCFPTSVAMVGSYYGWNDGTTTDSVASAAYRDWQGKHFPHRAANAGLGRYQFTYGNPSGGNVWEWWLWENRAVRRLVGAALAARWHPYENDIDGVDDFPADGDWKTFWGSQNLLLPAQARYLRRHLGRGWPVVVGTNLTGAGHIIVARGVVIRNDGTLHKLIVNNPWGQPGPNEARALYYNANTRGQTGSRLSLTNQLAVRHGIARGTVVNDHLVHGDGVGQPSVHRNDGALPGINAPVNVGS